MAGKKKKTLANRLAKMSDEERARYMQHKADVEEEAKRRKEQLISAFMKKKIKKEDGFARLNLAKINQNWHQILRKIKCQEMKQNVENMKQWMARVYDYKNRTISKLMKEIEEAEEQYSYNFKAHSSKISSVIEEQHCYINKLQEEYDRDLGDLIEETREESLKNKKSIEEAENHLKTVLYIQTTESQIKTKGEYEDYMLRINEEKQLCNEELHLLRKSREMISDALWRQLAAVVRLYVHQTDARRLHFAELKMLDVESASEISQNQETIEKEEVEVQKLESQFKNLQTTTEEKIVAMTEEHETLNKKFKQLRKKFLEDTENDRKKLKYCTSQAKSAIEELKKWSNFGNQLIILMKTCQKLETEREQITKWFPIAKIDDSEELCLPKRISAIESVKCEPKTQKSEEKTTEEQPSTPLEDCFENLQNLENFWFVFNKMNVDYLELKQERKVLREENKELRGMMRAILEAVALNETRPNTRTQTHRAVCSAPLKRIIFS